MEVSYHSGFIPMLWKYVPLIAIGYSSIYFKILFIIHKAHVACCLSCTTSLTRV